MHSAIALCDPRGLAERPGPSAGSDLDSQSAAFRLFPLSARASADRQHWSARRELGHLLEPERACLQDLHQLVHAQRDRLVRSSWSR